MEAVNRRWRTCLNIVQVTTELYDALVYHADKCGDTATSATVVSGDRVSLVPDSLPALPAGYDADEFYKYFVLQFTSGDNERLYRVTDGYVAATGGLTWRDPLRIDAAAGDTVSIYATPLAGANVYFGAATPDQGVAVMVIPVRTVENPQALGDEYASFRQVHQMILRVEYPMEEFVERTETVLETSMVASLMLSYQVTERLRQDVRYVNRALINSIAYRLRRVGDVWRFSHDIEAEWRMSV